MVISSNSTNGLATKVNQGTSQSIPSLSNHRMWLKRVSSRRNRSIPSGPASGRIKGFEDSHFAERPLIERSFPFNI
ncbi:hypothetical protein CARUB_v10012669mg [Capsella rubella]|uniref:Uncharacterized protein n=1 Tax=Capsella rubella TaxID=81985 RepID=R0IES3_9BRAS|nr:hypothetical protein CARUB_v10012669mg [Capsella rubella]